MLNIPIKAREALKSGYFRKNYRFEIEATETESAFVIENDNLVSESVSINEKMCSSEELKFGLCEGSTLEFIYFDKPNITGRHIKAILQCEYRDEDGELQWQEIPMGFFDVEQCSRQASTGIIKASCFNKLKSDYLDQKANSILLSKFDNVDTPIMAIDIKNILLNDYEIKQEPEEYEEFAYSPGEGNYCVFNLPFKFTNLYGADAFNAYEAGVTSLSTTKYVALYSKAFPYRIISDSDGVIRLNELSPSLKCFELYENNIYEYLIDILSKSDTNLNQDDIKREFKSGVANKFYFDENHTVHVFDNGLGITSISYMDVCFNDGRHEYYSTFGYKNGDSKINGTYKDMFNKTFENVNQFYFYIPASLGCTNSYTSPSYSNTLRWCDFGPLGDGAYFTYSWQDSFKEIHLNTGKEIKCHDGKGYFPTRWTDYHLNCFFPTWYTDFDKTTLVPSELSDFTLRDITSALFEINTQFGKLDRETDLFSGVVFNNSRLVPANTLYPSETLFPNSTAERANKAMYSALWADEGNVRSFKYLIITYKGLDEEGKETDMILQRTINEHGTDNYNMSDNWLFRNLVWTANQIGTYADTMVSLMRNVTWFPFEMWSAGLPYLETGDEIEINTAGGTYISYILSRKLSGIQNLQDTFQNGTLNIF